MDLIIFRPQIGDLLYGKIINSDMNYITVDCDIIKVKVPVEQLMKPTSMYFNYLKEFIFKNI
jgi:DNA-directed RNA polymerase subunit E'/Rpb7